MKKKEIHCQRMSSDEICPNHRRKSLVFAIPIAEEEEENEMRNRRLSNTLNGQRRYSTISQLWLPYGNEYHPQDYVPPSGPEAPQTLFLGDAHDPSRRISIFHRPTVIEEEEEEEEVKLGKKEKKVLFIIEPLVSGLILFPILVLFWECGWNLVLIMLNVLNGFPSNLFLTEITQEDFQVYSWESLVIPYLIVQLILLLYYLLQEMIYEFLSHRHWLIQSLILKCHIFVLASCYIVQWEMLWTIWDQFTPLEWYFELTVSVGSIFALIVFIGHLSDIVCSPFIYSYDSIEYSVHFGCPLLTREMKRWKINLINYILYEWVISNLSIMAWRGIYHYLDNYFYPDDLNKSAGLCLLIGYVVYFPLMYFQKYFEELNVKYEFWTFVSINFPQFYRNIRHLFAFLSCIFAWRGYWLLFDNFIYLTEKYYEAYLLFYILSFLILCLLGTSSSTNGPLSHMDDPNGFFPLYPHCYVSTVYSKLSRAILFKKQVKENGNKS